MESRDNHTYKSYMNMLGIFLFDTVSRPALGPAQPPIQWTPGSLSLGVKRPGHEADHLLSSITEVKECVELYLHFPNTSSWFGAYLSSGTTLPFSGYRDLSPGLKRPERETDHSPPSSAEVKEFVEPYLHSSSAPSWRGAQYKIKA
jgi:hypothetical protein